MARGWESKAIEAQIEEAKSSTSTAGKQQPSPEEIQAEMKKKSLLLSRKRVAQQLQNSTNDRYTELLRRSLTDLDAQIASLD